MKFGFCLEGIVQRHQKRRLPDVLQDLSLRLRVLCGFGLLNYCCLFQNLHGIQLSGIVTTYFTN